ncbi:MAG: DUF2089 family protein [Gemmatimonadota bacterium]|nr:DUF2089 family protein [Gemmatimonadota bacterium]
MKAARPETAAHPLTRLERSDLDLIADFVLASGSIKEVARLYGVSYPTMRGRLDRLIERVREALGQVEHEPLTSYLAELIEGGQLAPHTARRIRSLHRQALEEASI